MFYKIQWRIPFSFLIGLLLISGNNAEGVDRLVAVTYSFGVPEVDTADNYSRVAVPECVPFHQVGAPILPFRTARILLPPGCRVDNLSFELLDQPQTIQLKQPVEFGRTPVPVGISDHPAVAAATLDRPDPIIYAVDNPYPENRVQLMSVQQMDGYGIAIVRVFPVQYRPLSGQLLFSQRIRVNVTLSPIPTTFAAVSMFRTAAQSDDAKVAVFVDNPDGIAEYTSVKAQQPQPLTTYDYLLVTTAALTNSFQPLVAQKMADGLSVKVETVENILAGYAGRDNAEKLRNFIKYAYSNWNIQYVLLGGDVSTVPYRGAYAYCQGADTNMPCDLYFSCLDGSWNSDDDALWGEPNDGDGGGDVDLLGEVYVGRAPVDTIAEVENFLSKTLHYEQVGHANPNKVRFLAEYLGNYGGTYAQGGDSLDTILPSFSGYTVDWLDDRPTNAATWSASQCVAALNLSPHMVVHDGHANETYALRLTTSNVDSLTNTEPFLINSIGCYCGAFDYSSDCMAEELVKRNQHGAFAVLMNSRYGWFDAAQEWKFSGEFVQKFFNRALVQKNRNIGKANQFSKHDMIGSVETSGDMVYRWCYFEITLFGDPHVALREGDDLLVTPSTGLASAGSLGGSFTPSETTYTLTNSGASSVSWSASNTQAWTSLSAASGTLVPGAYATVTWFINSGANALPYGNYSDTLTFSNVTSGIAQNRILSLTIMVPLAEALDQAGLVVTTSGNQTWTGQTTTTHDGVDAAKSGAITHSQTSVMQTTITGPGTGTFWWKVSSESSWDYLTFYIDNVAQSGAISGTVDWQQKAYTVTTGSHTLKWIYSKDGSVNSGSDCGWVDQLTLPVPSAPTITTSSPLPSGTVGVPYNQTLTASGGTIPYTWSITAGNLPAGLSLSSAGVISGTAGTATNASFTVRVTGNDSLSSTKDFSLTVTLPTVTIASFDLSTDPGWTRQGEWAFGTPTGGGGTSHGHPDPTSGATGANVFGINLSGDYSTTIGGPYYLTMGPINLTNYTDTQLRFKRWLNTDYPIYVYATIDVSSDGINWSNLFTNPSGVDIADNAWTTQTYTLGSTADNKSTVYIRWGHRVASGAWAYSGWNIDDVEILGSSTGLTPPMITTSSPLLSGTVGIAYNQTLEASGGTTPYTWFITAGSLPAGLSLSSAGVISGTAGTATNASFTVRVTGNDSLFSTKDFNLMIEVNSGSLADAVDQPSLIFTTSGNLPWISQTTTAHDGVDAARSGTITDSQTSAMQTTITGPGIVSFFGKVSSENGGDYLTFYIDDIAQSGAISGEVDWQQMSYTLTAGSHTLKWVYSKDGSLSYGSDCGWVDQLTLPVPTAPSDDFESYTVNTWPSLWSADGNANDDTQNNRVVVDPSGGANQVLKLYGVLGSYWGALAYLPFDVPDDFTVQVRLYNGTETIPSSGHQSRGGIGLRTGTYWGNYARGLADFDKTGRLVRIDGTLGGNYALGSWHDVKVRYQRTPTQIIITYWVDSVAEGAAQVTLTDPASEDTLDHLSLSVGAGSAYFDDLVITEGTSPDPDSDSDGIPDWWEQQYFGGITNAIPNAVCSNGINTVIEAYIAGLDPNDPQSAFLTSILPDGILQWDAVSGRVYNVYWTTNLMTGFQCLESNILWTQGGFTNPSTDSQGFYKIDVRLEQ